MSTATDRETRTHTAIIHTPNNRAKHLSAVKNSAEGSVWALQYCVGLSTLLRRKVSVESVESVENYFLSGFYSKKQTNKKQQINKLINKEVKL